MSNQKLSFNKSTISKQVATAVQDSSRMLSVCVCEKKGEEPRVIHKTKMATWNGIKSSYELLCEGISQGPNSHESLRKGRIWKHVG